MKKLILICMTVVLVAVAVLGLGVQISAADETAPDTLYAQSAVLIDADSGRILYEKNGFEKRAMASTTKIMTCIVALEQGTLTDIVTASAYASSRPKVHLGMREGDQFMLEDLLYSLMLESHNDSAVAIAEHIGGSVESFAGLMNEKAETLGLSDTYFITPNGLDASNEQGVHSTTAADLSQIMRYCIMESPKREDFLAITRAISHSFSDLKKEGLYSCNNHNAFLGMMDGALTGKTGFTADAGYCYVGALERGGRTFIVALLACGWPNNRSYKWADTKKLMEYGLANYNYRDVFEAEKEFPYIKVTNGIPVSGNSSETATVKAEYGVKQKNPELPLLLAPKEQVMVTYKLPKTLHAPIKKGDTIGTASYLLDNKIVGVFPIVAKTSVEKITLRWCLQKIAEQCLKMNVLK